MPDGERSFLYALGACQAFAAADIDLEKEVRNGSRLLHVGYALLLPALDGLPMVELFGDAHQRGLLVSLDVAYHPEARWDDLRKLLPLVDIFVQIFRRLLPLQVNPSQDRRLKHWSL